MAKTRGGVYYNLAETEFFCNFFNIQFNFSSKFNKERFEDGLYKFIDNETNKAAFSYGIKLNGGFNIVFAIKFYQYTEKRGFYIIMEGEKITCKNDLTLTAKIITVKS